jgi:cellobiose phosphorylase
MPAAYNTRAEIREIEPYVYCQFTHSKYSPRYGASRLPWLSGSATWSYYAATQYILGIRPDYNGLIIDPCIPQDWKLFNVSRRFRNKDFAITIKNEKEVQKGVKRIVINNSEIKGNFIPLDLMKEKNEVVVEMG